VASRWQRAADLIGRNLNPIPPVPEAVVLPLVPSGRSSINVELIVLVFEKVIFLNVIEESFY